VEREGEEGIKRGNKKRVQSEEKSRPRVRKGLKAWKRYPSKRGTKEPQKPEKIIGFSGLPEEFSRPRMKPHKTERTQ
jgi:hypothetical protein